MSDEKKILNKLVRDKIPAKIEAQNRHPHTSTLTDPSPALQHKLIEETIEILQSLNQNPDSTLLEASDIFEVLTTLLSTLGHTQSDLLAKVEERRDSHGGLSDSILLHSVTPLDTDDPHWSGLDQPTLLTNEDHTLLELIQSELARSSEAWFLSAFFNPSGLNLLSRSFETFLSDGGKLQVLFSTMANFNRPEHFDWFQQSHPGIEVKVYHPQDLPLTEEPPSFHVKAYLFRRSDGNGSMIIGSGNLTMGGLSNNVEWNYFSPHEVNIPLNGPSPFDFARTRFDHYWGSESIPVDEDFLEACDRWTPPVF